MKKIIIIVSIAYRHLPLSGPLEEVDDYNTEECLHCLSALTPFGTGRATIIGGVGAWSPLPIGTYPFRDRKHTKENIMDHESPLPIGTYPFRDWHHSSKRTATQTVSIAYRHLPLSGLMTYGKP